MRQDEATLLDIAKAARLIQVFIGGMAKEAFLDDPKTQSSVLYQLLVKRLDRKLSRAVLREQDGG
jgi:uncharacterized protein with HEPN domain